MDTRYADWIAAYVAKRPHHKGWPYLYGACTQATDEMVAAFPELRRVAGFANNREHFWCETADGEIIDPTVQQFFRDEMEFCVLGRASVDYREFRPGDEVRVGKCMNCGDAIYARVQALGDPKVNRSACSDECETELERAFS